MIATESTMIDQLITEEMKSQYRDEGYMILPSIIGQDMLVLLREECSYFHGYVDAQLDAADQKTRGITRRGQRYFIANQYRLSGRLRHFLFSPLMAQITQAVLGADVYLFNEQWVLKGQDKGSSFAWHQDSGYVKDGDSATKHKPYLSCWCALDDVNEANGTVYVLPHSLGGTRDTILDHHRQESTNDLIGYTGKESGVLIRVPAGSVVAFSSYNLHRSGSNTTDRMRRVYLPQYSGEQLRHSDGKLRVMAVPFVRDGNLVYDAEADTAEAYGPFK